MFFYKNTTYSTHILLLNLLHHLGSRRRVQFFILLILMLITSLMEVLSLGSVLPFLNALSSPEKIFNHHFFQSIASILNITEPSQVILPITLLFITLVIFSGIFKILVFWSSTKFSFAVGSDLSINIYRRTLYQPYTVHCDRNSSQIISVINAKTKGVIGIINTILSLINSGITFVAILLSFIFFSSAIILGVFFCFGLLYFVLIRLTRKKLHINSEYISMESSQVIKYLQEGLGGIRDIIIERTQETYCKIYEKSNSALRRASASNVFISATPKYIIETLAIMTLAVIVYFITKKTGGLSNSLPMLGFLVMGVQRLLPIMQQFYASWTQVVGGRASLRDVLKLLDQPLPLDFDKKVKPLKFDKSITLKNLSFSYNSQKPYLLKDLNLIIPKGSRIGFIGATGSGKSTLLDIIMGLLQPSSGQLVIDTQEINLKTISSWQTHIAHVPQNIFLTDSSIEQNIAFGTPYDQIDKNRVKLAASKAQIAKTIESWPSKYQTSVGERGLRLSGGQRQRIGIARALYKKAKVLILDEATSALDNNTEASVMRSIDALGKDLTILIVAHRLSTLKECTFIVELENGRIKRIGSYDEILNK